MNKLRYLFKIISVPFILLSIASLFTFIVGIFYKNINIVFLCMFVILFIVGSIFFRLTKNTHISYSVKTNSLLTVLTIVVLILICSTPLLLSPQYTICNAIFETVSSWTTTGATVIKDPFTLPVTILLWRSVLQWIGGFGIMFFLYLILKDEDELHVIFETESGKGNNFIPSFHRTLSYIKSIFIIYTFLTVLIFILLTFTKMSIFESMIHAFSGISTGGLSNHADGLIYFNSMPINIIMLFAMLLGGMNFYVYFLCYKRNFSQILQIKEVIWYLIYILSATIIITIFIVIFTSTNVIHIKFFNALFEVVSMITTSGYSLHNYIYWPSGAMIILLILMFIGASEASAGGGIKIHKMHVILRTIYDSLTTKTHLNAIKNFEKKISSGRAKTTNAIIGFVISYVLIFIIGTFLVSFDGKDILTTMSATLACLSSTGTGFNEVGPLGSFAGFSDFSKVVLSIVMIAGKTDTLLFVMFIFPRFLWRKRKL